MPRLFGTSGIRGVANREVDPPLAMRVGLGLASLLGNSGRVVVGRDPRTSSEMLESALLSGLLSGGCTAVRAGMIPTPVLAFATRKWGARAGVMITASHNPPEYNGLKCWDGEGAAFTPEREEELEREMEGAGGVEWKRVGRTEERDPVGEYLRWVLDRFSPRERHRVVVDCGNGAASRVTPFLLREGGCEVLSLNGFPSGEFPGRGSEPSPESLSGLSRVVVSSGAELGFAHDGDADRIAVVDDRGRFVQPDRLLALVASHLVGRGEKVVTTVDASSVVEEWVERKGGKVVRTRVGDVSVARALKEVGGRFGGEPSGAWIFPEAHLAPDGPLAAVMVLRMLEEGGRKLSELLEEVPSYPLLREKLSCSPAERVEKMERLRREYRKLGGVVGAEEVDGPRITFEEGSWVLVRPSGTEPYLRITCEAREEGVARRRMREVLSLIV
ncbi:MAG: phosphoglucosamine mutase [Candidatus Hadarchaeales archaeon]